MFDMQSALKDKGFMKWFNNRPASVQALLLEFGDRQGDWIDYKDDDLEVAGFLTGFTEDDQLILSTIDWHEDYAAAIGPGPHKSFLPADKIRGEKPSWVGYVKS